MESNDLSLIYADGRFGRSLLFYIDENHSSSALFYQCFWVISREKTIIGSKNAKIGSIFLRKYLRTIEKSSNFAVDFGNNSTKQTQY